MRNVGRLAAGALVITAAFGLTACSANQRPTNQPPTGDTVTPVTVAPKSQQKAKMTPCTADDVTVQGGYGKVPKVTIPRDCKPPERLLTKDVVQGHGEPAQPHDTIVVRYQLTTWSNGKVVDGNFSSGSPFAVRNLGSASVIEGWNRGLVGAKKGDRRLLVVPPDLGYGATGKGPVGPNETLVFVIDILKIKS
jgi:peptidylprolyl isomerase